MGVILEMSNQVCGMGYLWNVPLYPLKVKIFSATRQQSSFIQCTSRAWADTHPAPTYHSHFFPTPRYIDEISVMI